MTFKLEVTKTLKRSHDWPEWFNEAKSNIQSLHLEDVIKFSADGTWTKLPLVKPPMYKGSWDL